MSKACCIFELSGLVIGLRDRHGVHIDCSGTGVNRLERPLPDRIGFLPRTEQFHWKVTFGDGLPGLCEEQNRLPGSRNKGCAHGCLSSPLQECWKFG